MLQSDHLKAKQLSSQLASLGYGKKTVLKKKITPVKSPFAFDYESLKPKQDDSALLVKQAVKEAQNAAKQAAELAQTVSDMHKRAINAESTARAASQQASSAVKAMETMAKQMADLKVQESKEDAIESIQEKVEETKEAETPFEITEEMVKTIVQMMHKLPELDKLEVSKGVRNASSFIYGGTKYKTSELMHGGGGSSTSTTVTTQTGVISNLNTLTASGTLTTIYSLAINGQFQHPVTDYTASGTTITYVTPLDSSFTGKPYTLVFSS